MHDSSWLLSNSCKTQRPRLDAKRTGSQREALNSQGNCVWTWMCTLTDLSLLTYLTPTHIHPWNLPQLWAAESNPTSFNPPSFADQRQQRYRAVRGMFFGGDKAGGWKGSRDGGRESWWAHTVGLYTVSVQTDVSLSGLCAGSHHRLSKLFLSLAGCM